MTKTPYDELLHPGTNRVADIDAFEATNAFTGVTRTTTIMWRNGKPTTGIKNGIVSYWLSWNAVDDLIGNARSISWWNSLASAHDRRAVAPPYLKLVVGWGTVTATQLILAGSFSLDEYGDARPAKVFLDLKLLQALFTPDAPMPESFNNLVRQVPLYR